MNTKIRHTKSTSGRTHRLTVTKPGRTPMVVSLRYQSAPLFDDQVQGDLIRKFWDTYDFHTTGPIGRVPDSVRIDPACDEEERGWAKPAERSPEDVADAVLDAHRIQPRWVRNREQIKSLIAEAVAADRATRA